MAGLAKAETALEASTRAEADVKQGAKLIGDRCETEGAPTGIAQTSARACWALVLGDGAGLKVLFVDHVAAVVIGVEGAIVFAVGDDLGAALEVVLERMRIIRPLLYVGTT